MTIPSALIGIAHLTGIGSTVRRATRRAVARVRQVFNFEHLDGAAPAAGPSWLPPARPQRKTPTKPDRERRNPGNGPARGPIVDPDVDAAAVAAERDRMAAIIDAGKHAPAAAQQLAFRTRMPAAQAIALLQAMPDVAAERAEASRLRASRNPNVGDSAPPLCADDPRVTAGRLDAAFGRLDGKRRT